MCARSAEPGATRLDHPLGVVRHGAEAVVEAAVPEVGEAPRGDVDVLEVAAAEVRLPHLLRVRQVTKDEGKDFSRDLKVKPAAHGRRRDSVYQAFDQLPPVGQYSTN